MEKINRTVVIDKFNLLMRKNKLNLETDPYLEVEKYIKAFREFGHDKSSFTAYLENNLNNYNSYFAEGLFGIINLYEQIAVQENYQENKNFENLDNYFLNVVYNRCASEKEQFVSIFKIITDVIHDKSLPYGIENYLKEDKGFDTFNVESPTCREMLHHLLIKDENNLISLMKEDKLNKPADIICLLYNMGDIESLKKIKEAPTIELNIIKNKNIFQNIKGTKHNKENLQIFLSLLKNNENYGERSSDIYFWKEESLNNILLEIPEENKYIKEALKYSGFKSLIRFANNKNFMTEIIKEIKEEKEPAFIFNFLKTILKSKDSIYDDVLEEVIDTFKDDINKDYEMNNSDNYAQWKSLRELFYNSIKQYNFLTEKIVFLKTEPIILNNIVKDIMDKSNHLYSRDNIERKVKKESKLYNKELIKELKDLIQKQTVKTMGIEDVSPAMCVVASINTYNMNNSITLASDVLDTIKENIFMHDPGYELSYSSLERLVRVFNEILDLEVEKSSLYLSKKSDKDRVVKEIDLFVKKQLMSPDVEDILKNKKMIIDSMEDDEKVRLCLNDDLNLFSVGYKSAFEAKKETNRLDELSHKYPETFLLSLILDKTRSVVFEEDAFIKYYDEKIINIINNKTGSELEGILKTLDKSFVRHRNEILQPVYEQEKNVFKSMMENKILKESLMEDGVVNVIKRKRI